MSGSLSKAEKSYIHTGLLSNPPFRADGRALDDFRTIALETGVAPLANGSARLSIGRNPKGGGGTEVLAATKLEIENIQDEGISGGRVVCSVTCSPAAYPHLSSGPLEDLQYDMTTVLHQTLSHPSLHPTNLGIIPGVKSWLLNLDMVVLADAGNIYDALFMAARAALWDTKVPRTRSVEYKASKPLTRDTGNEVSGMDIDEELSGFNTRQLPSVKDFELLDYWDEGDALSGRESWPVCITMNLAPPVHYLDATPQEEAATPLRLLLVFSFNSPSTPDIQAMRLLGPSELSMTHLQDLVKDGEKYAQELFTALNMKLQEEDVRRNRKARDRFAKR